MSTYTVVDEIKLKAPSWSAEGSKSILTMLNRAQNYLFSKPTIESVYVDPLTGDYPYLVTAATVFDYEIPDIQMTVDPDVGPINIRIFKVLEVFSENTVVTDYRNRQNLMPYISRVQGNKLNYKFTPVPARDLTKARVVFSFDPGTETTKYRMKCLIEPVQLTASTIPLMVDSTWEEALICGALGFIEDYDYGRSEKLDKFRQYYAPLYWQSNRHIDTLRKVEGTPIRTF